MPKKQIHKMDITADQYSTPEGVKLRQLEREFDLLKAKQDYFSKGQAVLGHRIEMLKIKIRNKHPHSL